MGLTYTRGAELRRARLRNAGITHGEKLLLLTSAIVLIAVGLTYAGRMRAAGLDLPAPVNLNTVTKAEELEPALATVFTTPAERRQAAKAILSVARDEDGPRALPNVGALARVKTTSGSLLSGAELAAIKPYFSVRTAAEFTSTVLWCAVAMVLAFQTVSLVWRIRGVAGDRILLSVVHLLVGIGFIMMVSRPDPLRDTLLAYRYTEGVIAGLALFAIASMIDLERAAFRGLAYVPLIGALGLSAVLIVFGSGPGASNAKVNLGPVQPIEAIRLLLALFLAGFFARRWELLRVVRTETVGSHRLPRWLNVPRLDHVLPVVAGVGAALLLFFFQKDLGPALLLSLMFLSLFAIARGGAWLAGLGFAGLVAGFGVGYLLKISSTLAARVEMWRGPWDNAVRGGDQIAQGFWALAAGAIGGTGAGLGSARFIPEGHTDLILATIGEELGFVGLLVAAAAFALVAGRGFQIARRASSDYRFFLAIALTLSLVIPVLVMAAGILGVLPLTGVVTPFLSYGGSAMAANFVAMGLLVNVAQDGSAARSPSGVARSAIRVAPADLTPFQRPVRWLGRTAAAAAVIMVAIVGSVQVVRADYFLVRPQLSVQADGGRRFQYNPRVLEALRTIPRGTIFDARGLPLATDDDAIVAKASAEYGRLGRRVADACPTAADRCYPAGPSFAHVLGDANTRAHWSAANSSYVERDSENLLRGFDDHAATVTTTDREGRASLAVRRDYTSVVPLVRHRWEPDHDDVKAMLARSRDVHLTIDARLQLAVASILERAATTTGSGKGAVVVLDAETGRVLASVSYPWSGSEAGAYLDRARYGLYPPGSTFKMITAAAALRESPAATDRTFACERVGNHRIGVRIPGFGPPIVDDVHDVDAHGRLAMHDAIVRSCNAYFAQLAVALGSESLARTAAVAGITLNVSTAPDRVRANLPHAGYGQGEVVTTPMRLARVAAAIGTDGIIREAPIVLSQPAGAVDAMGASGAAGAVGASGATRAFGAASPRTIETSFVTTPAARTLASYLRDAVLNGTGRLLRDHPARIAGKTGTAEVDEAASHAWFAGFAPYGQATRRISFAVVLENGGYGGVAAASVAGQVASAAAAIGLIK